MKDEMNEGDEVAEDADILHSEADHLQLSR